MALIDIPEKGITDDLTSTEFNQLLEALKTGIREINTLGIYASTGLFTGPVEFQDDVTIGGETGPFSKYFESVNVIWVGKNGGVYDGVNFDGKSPGKALGSFQNAIDNVVAIHGTPTQENAVVVLCIDAGLYEEAITCVDFVDIFAPNAILKLGGAGAKQLIIKDNRVAFNNIFRLTGTNEMIAANPTGGTSFLNATIVYDSGSGSAIKGNTTYPFYIDVKRVEILGGGVGICDCGAGTKHIHVAVNSIYLGSDNATGIKFENPGTIHGFIDGIGTAGAAVSGTTGLELSDGSVNLSVNLIKADVAYDVSNGSTLNLIANEITGTQTNSGAIVNVITPEEFEALVSLVTGKEDGLGTPAADGYILSSTIPGVRSWVPKSGDMFSSVYDPNTVVGDAFSIENFHGEYLDYDTGITPPIYKEGRTAWNDADNTLDVHTGLNGTTLQVNQESVRKFYNDTAGTLYNGKAVRYIPEETGGHPHAEYAIADTHETLGGSLSVVTGDTPPGEYGFSTFFGKVRGVDTTIIGVGLVYLSDSVAGDLTTTPPVFPSYPMYMGGITAAAVDGEIIVSPQSTVTDTFNNAWDGTIRENFDFLVTSTGSVITGTLVRTGGGDLTMIFSDGFNILDCTDPICDITLTPGSNSAPVKNYIYILKSTKALALSTSDWPAEEHIRVADVVLQSAANTLTYGAFGNRNWNDHVQGTDDMGENAHIGQWIRNRPASWYSGVEGTVTVLAGASALFSCTAGKVFQKHLQTFDSLNQLTDPIFVVNDSITPYKISTDLVDELLDANGITMATNFYNLVFWGINSKSSEPDKIMMNLPEGSYATLAGALTDGNNLDVYNIPKPYNGTGFLIARFTLEHANPGVWTLHNTTDLRGQIAGAGGGIGGGGATEFLSLNDVPSSYISQGGDILKVNSAETALEFLTGVSGTFTTADAKTVTVTNGIITAIV